eukprot:gnl/Dysnectes_brevis/1714_a1949_2088.p1 GENE.gnl/Dysnectes_brevis/1714_a1949_2088~~gnl/Dysnectes_brevis/1714_a1949_2088.p1  ORF type:complete len:513 (-),score=54.35 gnl/Dysnectes_brevis/1714_a1949_2088:112-1650(-)
MTEPHSYPSAHTSTVYSNPIPAMNPYIPRVYIEGNPPDIQEECLAPPSFSIEPTYSPTIGPSAPLPKHLRTSHRPHIWAYWFGQLASLLFFGAVALTASFEFWRIWKYHLPLAVISISLLGACAISLAALTVVDIARGHDSLMRPKSALRRSFTIGLSLASLFAFSFLMGPTTSGWVIGSFLISVVCSPLGLGLAIRVEGSGRGNGLIVLGIVLIGLCGLAVTVLCIIDNAVWVTTLPGILWVVHIAVQTRYDALHCLSEARTAQAVAMGAASPGFFFSDAVSAFILLILKLVASRRVSKPKKAADLDRVRPDDEDLDPHESVREEPSHQTTRVSTRVPQADLPPFSAEWKHSNIKLSKCGLIARSTEAHATVLFSRAFSAGRHRWELLVQGYHSRDVFIGAAHPGPVARGYIGGFCCPGSIAMQGVCDGRLYKGGGCVDGAGFNYEHNMVVTVTIDVDAAMITWTNDKNDSTATHPLFDEDGDSTLAVSCRKNPNGGYEGYVTLLSYRELI